MVNKSTDWSIFDTVAIKLAKLSECYAILETMEMT